MCGKFFKKNFSSVTVCFFLFSFLFSACGLESLYFLDPPKCIAEVNFGNENRVLDEIKFITADNSDAEKEIKVQGTAVYYKIFDDEQAARDSYNYITSNNSSSDISAGPNSIINVKKYSPLISEPIAPLQPYNLSKDSILVDNDFVKSLGKSVTVKIRLNKYGTEFPCGVYFSDALHNDVLCAYPRRHYQAGARKLGFEFSRGNDKVKNPIPQQTDYDVSMGSSSNSDGKWYVDLWAFSQGIDNSYTYSYSRAVHLGCIKIEESEYDN
ncbi:MAG: hypothetical protein Q4B64_08700 [Spirochaetales bacterium]|nr:hypothetical protein [Spirochaetales bacterium]